MAAAYGGGFFFSFLAPHVVFFSVPVVAHGVGQVIP
jgi:hypothetical protein